MVRIRSKKKPDDPLTALAVWEGAPSCCQKIRLRNFLTPIFFSFLGKPNKIKHYGSFKIFLNQKDRDNDVII